MSVITVALIPVGDLADAKSRLAGVLDADARRALSLAMLDDVIAACAEAATIGVTVLVTRDPDALTRVDNSQVLPMREPGSVTGLNAALTWALGRLDEQGAHAVLILPADIPLVRAEDIDAVVRALGDGCVDPRRCAIAPARDGGTNALAMRPPGAVSLHYGPDSAAAHRRSAREGEVEVTELQIERLAFDVDTPDDLALLPSLPAGKSTRAWLAAPALRAAEWR